MNRRRILAIGLVLATPLSVAEEARELPLEVLDEVLITGTQAGPALWQVKSGSNVLWVLALPPLVSSRMKWRSKQVERVLADTQEVLAQYGTGHIPESAVPKLNRKDRVALENQNRYLPEGQTLRDILPSDVYASFETATATFPVRDGNLEKEGDLERSRPDWARNLLSRRATLALDIRGAPVTDKVVDMAKRRKIKVTSVEVAGWTGYIPVLPATVEAAMDMCALDALLLGLEDRAARWKARANAWAVGNVKQLTELVRPLPSRVPQCEGRAARGTESKEKWLVAMERSLANNRSTLALVDATLLLSAGGFLNVLRSRGYEVVEP